MANRGDLNRPLDETYSNLQVDIPEKIEYKISPLAEDNYVTWKWQMMMVLRSKGLMDSIETRRTTETGKDKAAALIIASALSQQNMQRVINCSTAYDIWTALEATFENKSAGERSILLEQFHSYKIDRLSDISQAIGDIQAKAARLKSLGSAIDDETIITVILKALPESFRSWKSTWRMVNGDKPKLNRLITEVLAEVNEMNRSDSKALLAGSADHVGTNRSTGQNYGDRPSTQPQSSWSNKPTGTRPQRSDTCNYCKKKGHWIKDCRKKVYDDRNRPGQSAYKPGSQMNQDANVALMAAEEPNTIIESAMWIADSGCSIHMTPRLNWIRDYQPHETPRLVTLGDGRHIEDNGVGSITTSFGTLKNVHFVPRLKANLFSISSATSNDSEVQYSKDGIKLFKDGKLILSGHRSQGIYLLDFGVKVNGDRALTAATLDEWHKRFGHISRDQIKKTAASKAVLDLQIIDKHSTGTCEGCAKGKCKRSSHPDKETNRVKKAGVSLHFDTVGPFRQESLGKSKFLLICKDEASGYRMTRAVQSKVEIPQVVKAMISTAQVETGNKTCRIVTDNGTEFVNQSLKGYLEDRGIVHQRSAPYTPQQNGFIEREVRTIVESARTLLIQSGLPKSLWAEAVNVTTYVLNRSLSSRNTCKTPFELWFGRKPSVKNLHTFGQRAIVMYRDNETSKWQDKGLEHFLVGYTDIANTFRFYDPEMDQVIISCDAIFIDEQQNPIILDNNTDDTVIIDIGDDKTSESGDYGFQNLTQQSSLFWDDNDVLNSPSVDRNSSTDATWGQAGRQQQKADDDRTRTQQTGAYTTFRPERTAPRHEHEGAVDEEQVVPGPTQEARGRIDAHNEATTRDGQTQQSAGTRMEPVEDMTGRQGHDKQVVDLMQPGSRTVVKNKRTSTLRGKIKGFVSGDSSSKKKAKFHKIYTPPKRTYIVKARPKNIGESYGASDIHPAHVIEGRDRSARHGEKFYDANLVTHAEEPKSYNEAMSRPDKKEWLDAMVDELRSLERNKVWKLVPRPTCNVVTNKWVLKIKRDPTGKVDKYKARLVARGFSQVYGVDYTETYAPVANMVTIRMLFAYAAAERLCMGQFDVKTAFLYGDLDETVYMEQPEGFVTDTSKVWLLRRSLYGLKQSPRQWNIKFSTFLTNMNLTMSKYDNCIFYREEPLLIIAIYVDDGIIFAKDQKVISETLQKLKEDFEVHDMTSNTFLGFQFHRGMNGEISIHQTNYINSILSKFGMENCKPVETPTTLTKSTKHNDDVNSPVENTPYREAIGSLMYAAVTTRLDIAHAVNITSRKVEKPTEEDWVMVKRIFRYLKDKEYFALTYNPDAKKELKVYCDADFAGDTETKRSTTGMVILYGNTPVHWKSKRQSLITLSSTEAEIVSLCSSVKETIWLRKLAQELNMINTEPTIILCDNQSAISIATKEQGTQRTRHMSVQANYPKEQVDNGEITIRHVKAPQQLADCLTKPMTGQKFNIAMSSLMNISKKFLMLLITILLKFQLTTAFGELTQTRFIIGTIYVNPCYLLATYRDPNNIIGLGIDSAIAYPRRSHNGCASSTFDGLDDKDCNEHFENYWQKTVTDLSGCRVITRKKRGIISTVGELIYTATTNLVKSRMERILDRSSNATRDEVYNRVIRSYDPHHEMVDDLQDEYSKIKLRTGNLSAQLTALKETLPHKVWMLFNIYKKISTMTSNLQAIKRMCLSRKVATYELGEILNSDILKRMDPHSTYLEGFEVDPENYHLTITFTHTDGATTLNPLPARQITTQVTVSPKHMWIILIALNILLVIGIIITIILKRLLTSDKYAVNTESDTEDDDDEEKTQTQISRTLERPTTDNRPVLRNTLIPINDAKLHR